MALSAFVRDKRGGVAIIFALGAIVLVGCIGVALDYSRASDLRTRLQGVADAAVLNALNPLTPTPDPESQAQSAFRGMLSNAESATLRTVSTRLERNTASGIARLTLSFEARNENTLSRVLGIGAVNVGGTATAEVALVSRSRLHFLIDTSDSMGLAATVADRDELRALTLAASGRSCEFACHSSGGLALARDNNISLRVDVARRGAEQVIALARDSSPNITFSYSLHAVSNLFNTVVPFTDSAETMLQALKTVDVGYGHASGDDADTHFETVLPQVATWLDGAGAHSPEDVVFLVTDGVRSQNRSGMPEVRPISPAYCDDLKRGNRLVAVIYTEYVPPVNDHAYEHTVAHFRDQLEPSLRACASSPELYARGNTPGEIYAAFERVFMKTLRKQAMLVR